MDGCAPVPAPVAVPWCCCRCWSSEAGDRPSVDMLLECLDLMIEDRMQAEEEEDHDQQV